MSREEQLLCKFSHAKGGYYPDRAGLTDNVYYIPPGFCPLFLTQGESQICPCKRIDRDGEIHRNNRFLDVKLTVCTWPQKIGAPIENNEYSSYLKDCHHRNIKPDPSFG
jgi:hypothetical protein